MSTRTHSASPSSTRRTLAVALVSAVLLPSVAVAQSDRSPFPDRHLGLPSSPLYLATGDLDGDGLPEIAATGLENVFTKGVYLFSSETGSRFSDPVFYPFGDNDVAIADATGDGHLDLMHGDREVNEVVIQPGDGKGGFGAQIRLSTPLGLPLTLAATDLDGDTIPDVLAGIEGGNHITVFLGLGGGAFAAGVDYATSGDGPIAVDILDVDDDDIVDLVVTNENTRDFSIMLGVGDGSFGAATIVPIGIKPTGGDVGDFNGDGHPDLVAALNTVGTGVVVSLNNGDGTFPAPTTIPVAPGLGSVRVADFDRDGNDDLTFGIGSYGIGILWGNGDGTFVATPSVYGSGQGPDVVEVADFNGDGAIDIASGNWLADDVTVLLNTGDRTFGSTYGTFPDILIEDAAIGDFDGDGDMDMAAVGDTFGELYVYLNVGSARLIRLAQTEIIDVGFQPWSIVSGDFSGDGIDDLVVGLRSISEDHGAELLVATGTGSFAPLVEIPLPPATVWLDFGDLDQDGALDLVTTSTVGGLYVTFGNGDGTFQTPTLVNASDFFEDIDIGDMNDDGWDDLVVTVEDDFEHVLVFRNQGGGVFDLPIFNPLTVQPEGVACDDLDNDGDLDAVYTGFDEAYLGVGNGTGALPTELGPFPTASDADSVDTGDFDHDGFQDVIVGCENGLENFSFVSLLLGRGDGTFEDTIDVRMASETFKVHTVDMNLDGVDDFIASTPFARQATIMISECVPDGRSLLPPPVTPVVVPGGGLAGGGSGGGHDGGAGQGAAMDGPGTGPCADAASSPSVVCADDAGGGPSDLALSICGDDLTRAGSMATAEVVGAAPGAPVLLWAGPERLPRRWRGGVLVPGPTMEMLATLVADERGTARAVLHGGAHAPRVLYVQATSTSSSATSFSAAVEVRIGID